MIFFSFVLTLLYWIEPQPDADLARAAMQHWQAASQGELILKETPQAAQATLRFRFLSPSRQGLYGSAMARRENGREVQELFINPALAADVQDPLLATTILFLTCVHESGHGLGLGHTRNFADIMYSFQYGGDLDEYFARYRRRLSQRKDVFRESPIAPGDKEQLRAILAAKKQSGKRSAESSATPPR